VTGSGGARFLLFAGSAIPGPVVTGGPFVGFSAAQVAAFRQRFRSGDMGRLVPFAAQAAA
jgi:redox-sensitive bicupin YhaK (pirin superfamily)